MNFDFLKPIDLDLYHYSKSLSEYQIGAKISCFMYDKTADTTDYKIALLGIPHCLVGQDSKIKSLNLLRKEFYKLFAGNWDCKILDLGDIDPDISIDEAYFAANQIASNLLRKGMILLTIGGTQDFTYPLYRAYRAVDSLVNLVAIDSKFDLGIINRESASDSYLGKMIMEEPNNLNDFCNLGYQTYLNSQEELDLMEKMYFEYYRLGELNGDISLSEPKLRGADIVSIDFTSVESSARGNFQDFMPNGFTGKEICTLARYSGISDKVSIVSIFNVNTEIISEVKLAAQVMWYVVEGVVFRYNELFYSQIKELTKYTIPLEEEPNELVFYKSEKSQRWWVELKNNGAVKNKLNNFTLLPSREQEYKDALQGVFPKKWWKEQKKYIFNE
ncbi:MAG: formimidoylglutamase [Bacteroidota bacterium]|nr:formimidoylglutamase [Bacteroidota bacterium]